MIIHDKVRKFVRISVRTLVFLALTSLATALLYVLPVSAPTLIYIICSFTTFIVLVCMLQSSMLDSSIFFRIAITGIAAGSLAGSILPFVHEYDIGPWGMIKAMALLAFFAMLRHRQIKASRRSGCSVAAYQH